MPDSSNRTRTYRSNPRYDHNMGVLDTEIAQVAVPPDGTTKRVSESDGTVTPTDRPAEEYIDPKEERAFVSDIRTELNMKWLTICQGLATRRMVHHCWFPWIHVQVPRPNKYCTPSDQFSMW